MGWLLRSVVRLFPRQFRRTHEAELLETARLQMLPAHNRPLTALRLLLDVLNHLPGEWLSRRPVDLPTRRPASLRASGSTGMEALPLKLRHAVRWRILWHHRSRRAHR